MNKERNIIFKEIQKLRQWWSWLFVVLYVFIIGFFSYIMVKQLIFGKPLVDMPDTILLIFGGLSIPTSVSVIWLFYVTKLITEVRGDELHIRFFPFPKIDDIFILYSSFSTPPEKLKRYEVRTYNPMGWGVHYELDGTKTIKIYSAGGNHGVQIEFQDGERILIGSQKPEELAKAIDLVLRS